MLERSIPWASTYGNHDEQYNLSREALYLEENKYDLSLTRHSPSGVPGITNYFIPVFAEHYVTVNPAFILWFFDSRGGRSFQNQEQPPAIPDWVASATVEWFKSTQSQIYRQWGYMPPSLAFVHIPPTAFLKAQQDLGRKDYRGRPIPGNRKSRHFPGLNEDVPLAHQGDGKQDLSFMQALLDTPGLHSIYSGHDHGDSWCANWPNTTSFGKVSRPHLCFCKHTGYGGYGTWNRGSRIVEITFEALTGKLEVATWVRMEDGDTVQLVSLNETYGSDVYATGNGE